MKKLITASLLIVLASTVSAQEQPGSELYKVILSHDSLLFNIGFNKCDIKMFEQLVSDKLVFYHDKDTVAFKEKFMENARNGLCKSPQTHQTLRKLEPGSTEIFPLYYKDKIYGAIQTGIHSFYHKQSGKPEKYSVSARFSHVWILENENWKLTQVLSYDHQEGMIMKGNSSVNN